MHTPKKQIQPSAFGLLGLMLLLIGVLVFEKPRPETMTSTAVTAKKAEPSEETAPATPADPKTLDLKSPAEIESETLWLARCIYSETKRPREQELVAWVVRNRVETRYRGNSTYRSAVLDPYQFSAFNPGSRKRAYYVSLDRNDQPTGWRRALSIASYVREAPAALRPFPKTTRHFFSERSMVGRRHPGWSRGEPPVEPDRPYEIASERFRFYKGIS